MLFCGVGGGCRPFRRHGYVFVQNLVRSDILDFYGSDSYSGYLQVLPVKGAIFSLLLFG